MQQAERPSQQLPLIMPLSYAEPLALFLGLPSYPGVSLPFRHLIPSFISAQLHQAVAGGITKVGNLRRIAVEITKAARQSVAIQVLAPGPTLSWFSGWAGDILRVELAPFMAVGPEQGSGVGLGEQSRMGSFHADQQDL